MQLIPIPQTVRATLIAAASACVCITGCTWGAESDTRRVGAEDRRSDAMAESAAPETKREARNHGADVKDAVVLRYDSARDRLTLRARNVALAKLLERISAETGVEFIQLKPVQLELDELISVEFAEESLKAALDSLLARFNKLVIYSEGPRITRVLVGSYRVERAWSIATVAALLEAVASQDSERAWSIATGAALLEAVASQDSELALKIVDEFVESGIKDDWKYAVQRLREYADTADPTASSVAEEALQKLERGLEAELSTAHDPSLDDLALALGPAIDLRDSEFMQQIVDVVVATDVESTVRLATEQALSYIGADDPDSASLAAHALEQLARDRGLSDPCPILGACS